MKDDREAPVKWFRDFVVKAIISGCLLALPLYLTVLLLSFAQTLQTLSRWGSGAKHMIAAME